MSTPLRLAGSVAALGPGGSTVTSYGVVHDEQLRLIAVRRDLSGFQHGHPGGRGRP